MKLELNFIPPTVTDPSKQLTESVAPSGWEHLGGPLRWYETDPCHDHPKYGKVIPIRYLNTPIASLVKKLAQTKRETGVCTPPFKSILLSGSGGIGKTLLLQLLAETWLYEEHVPVGSHMNGNLIPFIDPDGNTININPDVARPSRVERALFTESLDDKACQVYNAGKPDVNKDAIATMVENLKRGYFPGKRRVFIIGEIDNISAQQSPPLKTGLDPHHGIPDHVLVLADTNNLAKVERNLSQAIQRFETIVVRDWRIEELAALAKHYSKLLNIQYDLSTFMSPEHPFLRIAEMAHGSVRELLKTIDSTRGATGLLTANDLEMYVNRNHAYSLEIPVSVEMFLNLPDYSPGRVAYFCREQAYWKRSLYEFISGLVSRICQNFPEIISNIAPALNDMNGALRQPDGLMLVAWIQISPHLIFIGNLIRTTLTQRMNQQASMHQGVIQNNGRA